MNSPSIETLFSLLEVLGSTPKEFFDDDAPEQKVVYTEEDQSTYTDEEKNMKFNGLFLHLMRKKWSPSF
ncbi:HTH-type transcriptional regulator PuuR OS=Lysinibacillus sphaericus OX=1421 GN=puuR_1 PE=4 SV=1 [Lysinibacillus sphaericus]